MPVSKFSSRRMAPADWAGVRYFKAGEFKYPDRMGYEFVMWLDELRHRAGVPVYLAGDYRTKARNLQVGGAADSPHVEIPCNAIDISYKPTASDPNWNYTRAVLIATAIELGCRRIGIYPNGGLHFDRTEDVRPAPRFWVRVDNPVK